MAAVAVVPGHRETGKGKGSCYIEIFLKIYLGVLFVRFMIGLQIQTKFQRNLILMSAHDGLNMLFNARKSEKPAFGTCAL